METFYRFEGDKNMIHRYSIQKFSKIDVVRGIQIEEVVTKHEIEVCSSCLCSTVSYIMCMCAGRRVRTLVVRLFLDGCLAAWNG